MWMMTNMKHLAPGLVLYETDNLVAFRHPDPAYPVHILIVPKKEIAGIEQIAADDQEFLTDLVTCTQSLVRKYRLGESGYRLIANGGKYQETPVLHFHLIADRLMNDKTGV